MCDDFEGFDNDFDNGDFMDDSFEDSFEGETDGSFAGESESDDKSGDTDLDGEPDDGDDFTAKDAFMVGSFAGLAYEEGIEGGRRKRLLKEQSKRRKRKRFSNDPEQALIRTELNGPDRPFILHFYGWTVWTVHQQSPVKIFSTVFIGLGRIFKLFFVKNTVMAEIAINHSLSPKRIITY